MRLKNIFICFFCDRYKLTTWANLWISKSRLIMIRRLNHTKIIYFLYLLLKISNFKSSFFVGRYVVKNFSNFLLSQVSSIFWMTPYLMSFLFLLKSQESSSCYAIELFAFCIVYIILRIALNIKFIRNINS